MSRTEQYSPITYYASPGVENPVAPSPPQQAARRDKLVAYTEGAVSGVALAGSILTLAAMAYAKDINPVSAIGQSLHDIKHANDPTVYVCPAVPADKALNLVKQEGTRPYDQTIRLSAQQEANQDAVELAPPIASASEKLTAATTASEATAVISEYTRDAFKFSVNLNVPTSGEYKLSLPEYKRGLQAMLDYISILPKGLITATKLTRLTITDLFNQTVDPKGIGTVGEFESTDGPHDLPTAKLDINYIADPGTFIHEILGHGIEHSVCKGAEAKDPAISSQNPADFHYDSTDDTNVTHNAVKDVTSSGYAQTNSGEDNAELTRTYISGDASTSRAITSGHAEGRKLDVILARFEKLVPGSVHYLRQAQPLMAKLQKRFNRSYFSYDKAA